MLNTAQPLNNTQLGSALGSQSRLRPSQARFRRNVITSLMLTSLVDAFSILVIFLIMNTANSQDVVNMGKLALPQAVESEAIQNGTVVRVENGTFLVEEKPVALAELGATLKNAQATATDAAKKEGIVIVADRNMDYEGLSPVILAGSQAGFTKFKFAVVRK